MSQADTIFTQRQWTEEEKQSFGNRHSIAARVQCLTLLALQYNHSYIEEVTGIGKSSQQRILRKARDLGFKPHESPRVLDSYVQDLPRSGRPKEIDQTKEQEILAIVQRDRAGREKSSDVLAYETETSKSSVHRILKKEGFSKVKPTTKPGLNKKQREARLTWCHKYSSWTIEDWKRVIFTDETSVILGNRRGTVRLWRRPDEVYSDTVIRRRWKGYSTFIFWGSFTYEFKGPYHIYKNKSAEEKKAATEEVRQLNERREPHLRQTWEASTALRRLRLNSGNPGKKPTWKFTSKTGKLTLRSLDGIGWYRHWKEILVPRLIPFYLELKKTYPEAMVMEDGAAGHEHHFCQAVLRANSVVKIDWPGNSPDLNPIEQAWFHLKQATTSRGAPSTQKEMVSQWKKKWASLSQSDIVLWIEGMMANIQKVIELKGGNEYHEGRQAFRCYKGVRIKGKLPPHKYLYPDDRDDNTPEEDWIHTDASINSANDDFNSSDSEESDSDTGSDEERSE